MHNSKRDGWGSCNGGGGGGGGMLGIDLYMYTLVIIVFRTFSCYLKKGQEQTTPYGLSTEYLRLLAVYLILKEVLEFLSLIFQNFFHLNFVFLLLF